VIKRGQARTTFVMHNKTTVWNRGDKTWFSLRRTDQWASSNALQ